MTTAHVQLLALLVSWCACAAQQFAGDPTVCVPCNPCGALPNIPQSFEAKIEVNIQNGNETYDVEEHFDGQNNRAVVYMTRQGRTGKQILNFNGGEVYDIIGTQCVAQQLEAGEDLFGYIPAPNGTHIFSSVVTFGMASRLGVTEMGRTTVRGIPVVNYRACTYWPQWDTTFIADYYFSTPEFQLAGGDPVIPVRITVSGKGRKPNAKPGEGRREFSRTYEYMYFRSSLRADWSVFETPRGVECHHRQSQETFPDIPNHQHYVQEQILPQQQIVDGLEIWYNYDQQLLRLDYVAFTSTFQPQEGRFGVPKRVIHDFNTGLEYETDLSTGACTMRRIVDSPLQLDNSNGVMLTPAQTLSLDGVQKYYMGKHLVRNILADGWIYRRQFNFSAGPMWVEYQLYFSSSEYVDHTGFADNTRVPLHIEFKPITVPGNYTGPMDKTVIKIYNFDLDQDITDFAVSNCYDASRKQVIRFQFPVSVSPLLKLYGRELTLQTKIQLCRAMGISFLRCEDVMYDSDDSATYVTMAVLEAPAVSPGPRDQPLTPTSDAIMALQQKIDSNQLVITLSRDIQITAISGTLQQDVYSPPSNIVCHPNKARQRDVSMTQTASSSTTTPTNSGCNQGVQNSASGFSAGTLAGVAVALLVSGVVLGLAVQYIIVRRRMKSAESAGLTSRMEMPDISSLPAAIPD
ncbi:uncharacterized protein LOC144905514 [Branchiostoma floridae x Branchiostoma belcheri]